MKKTLCIFTLYIFFQFLFFGSTSLKAQENSKIMSIKKNSKIEIKSYYSLWHSVEVSLFEDRTPMEKFGLAMEIPLKEYKVVEIGGSLNKKSYEASSLIINEDLGISGIYDYNYQIKNQILNVTLKKYSPPSTKSWSFYVGGYIRYWHHRYKRINTNEYPIVYVHYLNLYPQLINEHIHKISVGIMGGVKKNLGQSPFTIGLNIGAGTSIYGGYIIKEDYWANKYDKTYLETITPTWLSLRSEFSIGYRFN